MTRPPEKTRQTAKPPFQVVHCAAATAPATTSPVAATQAVSFLPSVAKRSTNITMTAVAATITAGRTTWIELFI